MLKLFAIKKHGVIYPQRFATQEAAALRILRLYGSINYAKVVRINPELYGTPEYATELNLH
jgi:hypothetical protein